MVPFPVGDIAPPFAKDSNNSAEDGVLYRIFPFPEEVGNDSRSSSFLDWGYFQIYNEMKKKKKN